MRQQGALLWAELGHITVASLPLLLAASEAQEDLTRLRARSALAKGFAQPATHLGREVIEALAREAHGSATLSLRQTYAGWALTHITHDNGAWLAAVWALRQSKAQGVREAALETLGHWPWAVPPLLAQLRGEPVRMGEEGVWGQAVARLGARLAPTDPLDNAIRANWQAPLPHAEALAGLVRLLLTHQKKKPATLAALRQLVGEAPPVPAPTWLAALLAAGKDDDSWDDSYHGRIAQFVGELAEEGEVLNELLTTLPMGLAGDSWPARRIALAAIAQCAAAMPDALNLHEGEVGEWLVAGTQDSGSHNSRRFGLTALSHLQTLTPAILETLLHASQDMELVQQDALAAIPRFRQLGEGFAHEEALATLEAALVGESGAAAYTAAQLLGALGQSPALVSQPALRENMAKLLRRAWDHPRAQERVYVQSKYGNIEEKGTRAQVVLAALLQVRGVPNR